MLQAWTLDTTRLHGSERYRGGCEASFLVLISITLEYATKLPWVGSQWWRLFWWVQWTLHSMETERTHETLLTYLDWSCQHKVAWELEEPSLSTPTSVVVTWFCVNAHFLLYMQSSSAYLIGSSKQTPVRTARRPWPQQWIARHKVTVKATTLRYIYIRCYGFIAANSKWLSTSFYCVSRRRGGLCEFIYDMIKATESRPERCLMEW